MIHVEFSTRGILTYFRRPYNVLVEQNEYAKYPITNTIHTMPHVLCPFTWRFECVVICRKACKHLSVLNFHTHFPANGCSTETAVLRQNRVYPATRVLTLKCDAVCPNATVLLLKRCYETRIYLFSNLFAKVSIYFFQFPLQWSSDEFEEFQSQKMGFTLSHSLLKIPVFVTTILKDIDIRIALRGY